MALVLHKCAQQVWLAPVILGRPEFHRFLSAILAMYIGHALTGRDMM